MNEQEWLASADPTAMLASVKDKMSARRLRLFTCGCCRLVWDRLTDPRSRKAIEVADRYADGLATNRKLAAAHRYVDDEGEHGPAWVWAFVATSERPLVWLTRDRSSALDVVPAAAQAALLRDVCGNPFRAQEDYALCAACGLWFVPDRRRYYLCPGCGSQGSFTRSRLPHPWLTRTVLTLAHAAYAEGREVPCGRCGGRAWVGPPSTSQRCPSCTNDLGWSTGRTSDGLLDPDRFAILTDALEEAGCREEAMLRHLRGQETHRASCFVCQHYAEGNPCPHCINGVYAENQDGDRLRCDACRGTGFILPQGPHARGCHALDLILGRA